MPEKSMEDSKGHYILGLLLFITGLLVVLVIVTLRSQADDATSSANITNATPTITSVTISSSSLGSAITNFNLNEYTTAPIYVWGSYQDANGCDDVATNGSLRLNLYRSLVGSSCSTSDLNCYTSSTPSYSCALNSCSGGADTTGDFECTVPVQYFADATDAGAYISDTWFGLITATDQASASGTGSQSVEVNTLTALDVTPSINYGTLAIADISASDVTSTITNTGNNDALDVAISGSSMSCTVGTIAPGKQHYSLISGQAYGSMTALTGSPVTEDTNIPKALAVASPSLYDVYWKLEVPSGVNGSCTGTTTFSAI